MASKEGKFKKPESNSSAEWSAEEKPVKVNKWDTAALKNSLDDSAKKVMTEHLSYRESHALMDGRLLICTIAVGFAAFALIWDYLHPFPGSRTVLIICVVSYFIMMTILTAYTTLKEQGKFLVAIDKDLTGVDPDNVWTLSSHMKRYDPVYNLSVVYYDGKTKKTYTGEKSGSVAKYFDENGVLCMDLFEPEVRKLHDSLLSEKKTK